jgi:chromosome segregation ATPase
MPEVPSSASSTWPRAAAADGLPAVRLELRHAAAKPTSCDVPEVSFLIGSVPGCDLRLPGANLPPVLCLLSREPEGVTLRKLAPTQAVLVNARPVSSAPLADGDRLTIGACELLIQIRLPPGMAATPPTGTKTSPAVAAADATEPFELASAMARKGPAVVAPAEATPAPDTFPAAAATPDPLLARQKQLDEQSRDLETDRVIWYRRREEIERECRQLQETAEQAQQRLQDKERELAQARADLEQREEALERERDRLAQRDRDLETLSRQKDQMDTVRTELTTVRQGLYERYRERRDRLAGLQEAVRAAAQKVQERKRAVDAEMTQLASRHTELDSRAAELDDRAEELTRVRSRLEEEYVQKAERVQTRERELAELVNRQTQLDDERRLLDLGQVQHRADLLRFERRQAVLEQRQKQLEQRALEVDRRFEQLQRDSRELDEQARRLDDWRTRIEADAQRLAQDTSRRDQQGAELARRAADLEGQQAMLATLRTRLERTREEVRRESQLLTEQRTRQEAAEQEIQQRLEEAGRLRDELSAERKFHAQEQRRLAERSATLEAAVAQVQPAQAALVADQTRLRDQMQQVQARLAEQAEQAAILEARAGQLTDLQQRLEADRQALREREKALAQAEQVRETLQAQLHRRAEELTARQRALADREKQQEHLLSGHQEQLIALQAARADVERGRQTNDDALAARLKELDILRHGLETREQQLEAARGKLAEVGRAVAAERKLMAEERAQRGADHQAALDSVGQTRLALEADRQDARALVRQLPELEQRAQEAAERLTAARDRLREHLAELHSYARQSRDDLEVLRGQVQAEAEQVRQERQTLHRSRDEHRLAVAAFRQQIIDWQGQLAEMKQALAQGETRLERKRAEVNEQARQIDATSARLVQQAQELEAQQRQVAEKRGEVERHLEDMRQWYRRKLRELAIGEGTPPATASQPRAEPAASPENEPRTILALTGDPDPGDRQLGDLLRSLELVDADTLTALLVEARRQRRSLRQVLLAGGYLTLYQLALIEAGNLDGLVLGPTRVIDRVRATAREAVYRVFDPRRGRELLLRHLAEAEAADASHVEEFRQRFTAALAVQHSHIAATLEVLEIAGRPAVLQECLNGLRSPDWPALAAVPGVWYRLTAQAALGLQAAHQAGLVHGHLRPESVLLTSDGVVKLCGFGEPRWLCEPAAAEETPDTGNDPAADLSALGAVALSWASAVRRKGSKVKPLPESLQTILHRLTPEAGEARLLTATALLEALDQAGDVPPNAEAWERLLHYVRDHVPAEVPLRKSA